MITPVCTAAEQKIPYVVAPSQACKEQQFTPGGHLSNQIMTLIPILFFQCAENHTISLNVR